MPRHADTPSDPCSRGNERATSCHPRAVDNLRALYGDMWPHHWTEFDGRVAAVADALGLDPHALDDNIQDRGWEYHDTGIQRAIAQGAYALLHPDDADQDGPTITEDVPNG